MTLTKKKMVREIGRHTRLTNRRVQEIVEALIDVWTETLIDDQKIEIQNFLVLEVRTMDIRLFHKNNSSQIERQWSNSHKLFGQCTQAHKSLF